MLREGSSDIASFVEHPAYGTSKTDNILILVFLFWFATTNPKCMCKSQVFLNFYVLREKSSDIASFVQHPVYSIIKM